MTNKKTPLIKIISFIVILILITTLIYLNERRMNERAKVCKDSFLDICFDKKSIYYQCRINSNLSDSKNCNPLVWKQASLMRYLQENNLSLEDVLITL